MLFTKKHLRLHIVIFLTEIQQLTNMKQTIYTLKHFMTKKLAIVCIGVFFAGGIHAQVRVEPKPAPKRSVENEKAREQTRWMYKNLSLNTEQYEKVNDINLLYAHKCDSIDKISSTALKNGYKQQLKKEKENQLKLALTEQQFAQYSLHKDKQTSQKKSPFTGTYLGN